VSDLDLHSDTLSVCYTHRREFLATTLTLALCGSIGTVGVTSCFHRYNSVAGVLVGSLVVKVTLTVQSDVLHASGTRGDQEIIRKLAQTVSKLINMNWYK
jgi:hypothetical protein